MPRAPRNAVGDVVYHVINRGNSRQELFRTDDDYRALIRVTTEAMDRVPMRICSFCIMPNHWHFVLWPHEDGALSRFMAWFTNTHSHRWRAFREETGAGHVYQGRFKSFPVQTDSHFWAVCRYVEGNPLRAGLVRKAERWPWSSLAIRERTGNAPSVSWLSEWPVPRPPDWVASVNASAAFAELSTLRRCVSRGTPYGDVFWSSDMARRLGLEVTIRPSGRPRKGA
jgi:putative transposase